ncbi:L-2-hydroxycarboxylate dehydrogenase (NAD+) [Burkholderiales bacterium]|nr:L-2-hydroxycarboxylate dehydrogenase (NAD+) [Burkholderiales bacterium]
MVIIGPVRRLRDAPARRDAPAVAATAPSMKTVSAAKLADLVAAIMHGAGSSHDEARAIARRLVDSNLVGHDSHGVLRVGKYLEWVRDGTLKPNTPPEIVFESDTIAIVDGRRGFGQVTGEAATRLGIAKAKAKGIAMIGLRNCGHLGRLGDWAEMAAEAGQVSLHFLNTSGAQRVAPFGGSDRRLSTNPMSIGVPVAGSAPAILDITTSTVAEGKLMVAMNRGDRVPEGWIVDKAGRPTTDPKDFYDGGALLTIGAHKGSGLSILTDLLAGAVTTGRSSDPADTILRNNMLSIYIDPSVYDASGGVLAEARRLVDWVKASPPATAGEPVLAPGDVERRTRAARQANGVPLDDKTWRDLIDAARSVGIDDARVAAIVA